MANTYTQINIHAIFAIQSRDCIINEKLDTRLYEYLAGTLNSLKQFSIAVNGHRDHVHLFFELNPAFALSDIVREVKSSSSRWVNKNNFIQHRFNWQEGYGAFSYSKSQRNSVVKYIENQHEHHKKSTFKNEYFKLLQKFDIDFKDEYAFKFIDNN